MNTDKFQMFENRLTKVYRHRHKQAKKLGISCYRIYDHDLPEFPFCIESYDGKLFVAEYKRNHGMTESEHVSWMEKSLAVMMDITNTSKEDLYLRLRARKPGRLGQYLRQGHASQEFVVEENALKFIINLSDYLDTGLFLDHRVTRGIVKDLSKGKKVLNLFAYTGSFSVYAAAGGAREVHTVDLSKTYLQWAEKNMTLNGFTDAAQYKFIHADAIQYLKSLPADSFDIIIMDPPTFSNSQRMDGFLDIQRDHVSLIKDCLHALNKGGLLFFSSNSRKFKLNKEEISGCKIKDIIKPTNPFDFEGKFSRFCFQIEKK